MAILVGGFRDRPSNRRIRRILSQIAPAGGRDAVLLLTFPSGSFPAGTVMGWPESTEDDKQEHAKFSQHMCFGVPTQPVGTDARQVNRHANLAKHPCNTRVILFSPRPSARVAAITQARILHLMSVLHGTLVPHPDRGDRYPLLWRGWADSSYTLRYSDIPSSFSLDPLRCIKMCAWEYYDELVPPLPPSDNDKSAVALAQTRLLVLRNDTDNPFPKHVVPHDFVAFLRAHTHVPAAYAATAAVTIIRAGLNGQFTFERARAAMIACVLRMLNFHTPQSMMSMQGVPVARDRCHVCNTWVVSRWVISDAHGEAARALIGAYVEDKTKTGAKCPLPFDSRRESIHHEVVRVVTERFVHLAHTEGILVCWACAIPVVLQIHARNETHDHPTEGPPTDTQTGHPPRPGARPTRTCTRTAPQLNLPPHDTSACIRDCVACIVEQRPLACGLVCHSAPCAQPVRVPYGHGGLAGTPFEYRMGGMAQV